MSALCCPRVRSGTGWFSVLKEALRRVFFSTEETPQPLQPSREKVNQRATALLDQYGEHILRLAYSTAQIAQILDQKESTVRSRLKRGREKLKPLLEEVGALG